MIRKNIDVSLGEDGARPIAMLVQLASQYVSNIEIHRDTMTVNAKSIMGMMTLGLAKGQKLDRGNLCYTYQCAFCNAF